METIEPVITPAVQEQTQGVFVTQLLLDALYFAWDAAERGQLDLFLIKDTARQAKADKDLVGDCITVGARKSEWISGQGEIFRTCADHVVGKAVKADENEVIYEVNGVPVIIKLYDENECLKSFNPIFYRYETFNLPNPYDLFVEKYE